MSELHEEFQGIKRKHNKNIKDNSANIMAGSVGGMSGLGKGKGEVYSSGGKRHRKVLRDNLLGVTRPAIRRLCRRGGVKRISGGVYDEARVALTTFLKTIVRDSVVYTEYARRRTVTSTDIVYALKKHDINLYGFGGDGMSKLSTKTKEKKKKATNDLVDEDDVYSFHLYSSDDKNIVTFAEEVCTFLNKCITKTSIKGKKLGADPTKRALQKWEDIQKHYSANTINMIKAAAPKYTEADAKDLEEIDSNVSLILAVQRKNGVISAAAAFIRYDLTQDGAEFRLVGTADKKELGRAKCLLDVSLLCAVNALDDHPDASEVPVAKKGFVENALKEVLEKHFKGTPAILLVQPMQLDGTFLDSVDIEKLRRELLKDAVYSPEGLISFYQKKLGFKAAAHYNDRESKETNMFYTVNKDGLVRQDAMITLEVKPNASKPFKRSTRTETDDRGAPLVRFFDGN